MSNRITHIRKPNVNSTVEHITHVKGTNNTGEWSCSVPEVIAYIRTGNYQFHVERGGYRIDVTIATSAAGNDYIKTRPDATLVDNLLSLPQF